MTILSRRGCIREREPLLVSSHMRDRSKGRFERMQCVKCGAHVMVAATAASASCEVCGGAVLVPVDEKPALREPLPAPRRGES